MVHIEAGGESGRNGKEGVGRGDRGRWWYVRKNGCVEFYAILTNPSNAASHTNTICHRTAGYWRAGLLQAGTGRTSPAAWGLSLKPKRRCRGTFDLLSSISINLRVQCAQRGAEGVQRRRETRWCGDTWLFGPCLIWLRPLSIHRETGTAGHRDARSRRREAAGYRLRLSPPEQALKRLVTIQSAAQISFGKTNPDSLLIPCTARAFFLIHLYNDPF